MKRVIKTFDKFDEKYREEIYNSFQEGELERTSFPFQGEIAEGVIFDDEECIYLIPVETVKASHLSRVDEEDKQVEAIEENIEMPEEEAGIDD